MLSPSPPGPTNLTTTIIIQTTTNISTTSNKIPNQISNKIKAISITQEKTSTDSLKTNLTKIKKDKDYTANPNPTI